MGGQTFNSSGVNLKVMLACRIAASQSPLKAVLPILLDAQGRYPLIFEDPVNR